MSEGNQELQEVPVNKEIILPPKIIRPLARALYQRFSPHLKAIQDKYPQKSLGEFINKLATLQKAKEVKLIEDVSSDPEFPSTFGIECSDKLEEDISIPPSTTIIEEPLQPNLGLALQDYLMSSINAVQFPSHKEVKDQEVRNHHRLIVNHLRVITGFPRIIIVNTEKRSTFQPFGSPVALNKNLLR